jgi:hypothetical protein
MNEVSTVIVFLVLIVFFTLIVLIIAERNELFLEYRNAKLNNKNYGIQETFNKSNDAIEILAKLHDEMENFINDLKIKYPDDDRVKRLVKGFKNTKIEEAPDDDGSSFTIDKGSMMGLCLRHKKGERDFHDYNTLQFVIIHELGHIASISEQHTPEFVANFKWLLKQAYDMGIYEPVNYQINPITYCGVKVTNNPYFS